MSRRVSKFTVRALSSSILSKIALTFGAFSLGMGALGISAMAGEYVVNLNKTQILHLPAPAAAVVVGNPDIADISVHSADTLFIIGRGYGETNLIALDELGQTILNAKIIVTGGMSASGVRIVKIGEGQESYNCAPYCQPAPVLGDSPAFQAKFGGNALSINNGNAAGISGSSNGGQASSAMSSLSVPPMPMDAQINSAAMAPNGQFTGPPAGYTPPSEER